jgi:Holliday junction resolvase RusA-like endonuclease
MINSYYPIGTLYSLPIPPSVNRAYRNVPGVGRVASKELRAYKDEMQIWGFKNQVELQRIRPKIEGRIISLDFSYYLLEKSIFTKAHVPKRYDVSNRIKIIEDSLCELLLVDDKFVFYVSAEKILSKMKYEYANVLVSLRESLPPEQNQSILLSKDVLH